MASVAMIAASAQITGQWTGEISVSGFSLKLNFNFATDDSGKTTCTIDSPDQNAFDIPCQEVSITDNSVNVKIDVIKATYSGTIQGDSIVGNFTQGATLPLTLRRNAKPQTKIECKQTPQPPFPYTVKEVTFANPAAGITLAGTLTLPENTKNVPAVVMITGSGAQNRDEELFAHRPFAVIADYLTRQGIAVLRYDDRGTAASGGKFPMPLLPTLPPTHAPHSIFLPHSPKSTRRNSATSVTARADKLHLSMPLPTIAWHLSSLLPLLP